jgi:hypothetical protein
MDLTSSSASGERGRLNVSDNRLATRNCCTEMSSSIAKEKALGKTSEFFNHGFTGSYGTF